MNTVNQLKTVKGNTSSKVPNELIALSPAASEWAFRRRAAGLGLQGDGTS